MHFIPLSMGYKEIYNLHSYFSGPTNAMLKAANLTLPDTTTSASGPAPTNRDEELRKIARAGRQWKMTIGRKVDMESECSALSLQSLLLSSDEITQRTYIACVLSGRGCGQTIGTR